MSLAGQASKAIFKIQNSIAHFSLLTPQVKLELFEKSIQPILMYGSEIWGFTKSNVTDRVQSGFYKRVLGVRKNLSDVCVFGELGQLPLANVRFLKICKYWLKVVMTLEPHRHPVRVYQKQYFDYQNGRTDSWAGQVAHMLNSNGFGEVWLNQGVVNVRAFLVVFRQRIKDSFLTQWWRTVGEVSKCDVYRLYKAEFALSAHLTSIGIPKFRNALTRFLTSGHNLFVETGRWANIPRNARLCPFGCTDIEDEYHFALVCPNFLDIRKKYIKKHFYQRPSMYKFVQLLNSNQRNLKMFAQFLFYANERRTLLLLN